MPRPLNRDRILSLRVRLQIGRNKATHVTVEIGIYAVIVIAVIAFGSTHGSWETAAKLAISLLRG